MDKDAATKTERLEELADSIVSSDRFIRLTAYTIVKVLTAELNKLAQARGYPATNYILEKLSSIEIHAGALAGVVSYELPEDHHKLFYFHDLSKLDSHFCFR
jgi:hypothetical protein